MIEAHNVLGEFVRSSSDSSVPFLSAFWAFYTFLPLLFVITSQPKTVLATHEFTVYRMQQFDFQNVQHGCRNSIMNLEAKTLNYVSQSFAKRCLIVKLSDIIKVPDLVKNLINQSSIGGLLILLPLSFTFLTPKEREIVFQFEKSLSSSVVFIPVYFAYESEKLLNIYDQVFQSSDNPNHNSLSSFKNLLNSVIANNYLISTLGSFVTQINDASITNLEGKLLGNGAEDQLTTISITSHYDSFGAAPGLAFGSDSNGSGVVALLELARVFSKLYSNSKTQPKVNLVFLLSGAGKFSFLGTKKWIEDNLDNSVSNFLGESQLTICLDTIAGSFNKKRLYMHVSKPPKENSSGAILLQDLIEIGKNQGVNVSLVHKKINLADEQLAWEHERFSLRRLSAMTISSLNNYKDPIRGSLLDTIENIDFDILSNNIKVIAEAISRQVFEIKGEKNFNLFDNDYSISKSFIRLTLNQISNQSRSQPFLLTFNEGSSYKYPPVLLTFQSMLNRFTKETRLIHFKPDQKERELVFYQPLVLKIKAFNNKPAVFDLVVSTAIILYLGILYLILTYFSYLQLFVKSIKSYIIGIQNETNHLKSKQH